MMSKEEMIKWLAALCIEVRMNEPDTPDISWDVECKQRILEARITTLIRILDLEDIPEVCKFRNVTQQNET